MSKFTKNLINNIFLNINNYHEDNQHNYSSDNRIKVNPFKAPRTYLLYKLLRMTNLFLKKYDNKNNINNYDDHLDEFEKVYNLLADDFSKKTYLDVLTLRIMGNKKYKLSLNTEKYWEKFKKYENEIKNNDNFKIRFKNWSLKKISTSINNYNIQLFTTTNGIIVLFDRSHYEYKDIFRIHENDNIIDAGACWGDTSLYFAAKCGKEGKVFAFEPLEENLKVLNKNFELNPELSKRISLNNEVLMDISDKKVCIKDNGPGSKINDNNKNGILVNSITIDDFIERNNIEKIDFIKMDIEGAELPALKGGVNTIRKFKPRLAISIYHSIDDFYQIPLYINSLDLGYKLFFNHHTISLLESVIYAKV